MPNYTTTLIAHRHLAGSRPSTAASRTALARADAFHGLPEGVTRWRLAAAVRAAARHLDLSPMMLRLLEHYIDLTWDADWTPNGEPVVIRPLVEIATTLDRTERQIRNVERALVERGLLAWRDSGNLHRRGRRDHKTGKLLYGFGPSLAPLGARAAEIIALADTARQETVALSRLRTGIAALRRRLRLHLAAALEAHVNDDTVHAAATVLEAVPTRFRARDSREQLTRWHTALTKATNTVEARLETKSPTPQTNTAAKNTGQAEISTATYTKTKKYHSINGTSTDISAKVETSKTANDDLSLAIVNQCMENDVTDNQQRTQYDWHQIVERMQERAIMFDIDQHSWANACARLGRTSTAACAIILENRLSRPDVEQVQNPRAYFNALIKRGMTEKLNLRSSFYGIARRRSASCLDQPSDQSSQSACR